MSGKSSSAQNTHLGSCLMSSTEEKQNARFGNICDEINDLTIYAIIGPVNSVICVDMVDQEASYMCH